MHGSEPQVSAGLDDLQALHLGWCVLVVWKAQLTCLEHVIIPPYQLAANPTMPALQGTWPTGIQAPLMDEGDFECLDYVYVWSAPGYDVK